MTRFSGSEDPYFLEGPPADLDLADDVLFRNRAPMPAVGAVVPVVAHDEVVALLHHFRAVVVMTPERFRHVIVAERKIVDVDATVLDSHAVAFPRDDPLDEHLLRI